MKYSKAKMIFGYLLILAVLMFASCESPLDTGIDTGSGNTRFIVNLHHPYASDVELLYIVDGETVLKKMAKLSSSRFEINVDINDGSNCLFNMKTSSSDFPGSALWVGKAIGIDAIDVSVNGVSLSNDFLVKTGVDSSTADEPSAAFSLIKNGNQVTTDSTGGTGVLWNPDVRMPPELSQYHEYCRLTLPPAGFSAALPWMQTLHNGGENDSSMVEVDYLKITVRGGLSDGDVLFEDDYSTDLTLTGYDHGGTYLRYPFFYDEETYHWAMPAEIFGGNLIVQPDGSYWNRAFHWWTSSRATVPGDAEYLEAECRFRITGDACVQLGIDFWRDLTAGYAGLDVNNTEAGVSDFYFNTGTDGEWQTVTFSTENLIPWVD